MFKTNYKTYGRKAYYTLLGYYNTNHITYKRFHKIVYAFIILIKNSQVP